MNDFPRQCKICDQDLPVGREDELCESCRRVRMTTKRDMRHKVLPNLKPAEFAKVETE